jgi:chemotaxis protein histidine kinase CheA
MAENSIQIDLELTTKAFETAISQAAKSAEGFSTRLDKALAESQKELDATGKAGEEAGKAVKKGGEDASGAWEVFKGVLGAEAVVGAFNFIKDAAHSLFDTFIVEGVKGAEEAEASLIKLKSALMISGDAANGTLEDFQDFANQLQKNTSADGDAVLSQLALAKQYGLTNAQAKQVVSTAQDMAARGYDADESVRKLSESFSGQAGKLAKLNPLLRDLTEEQLKAGAAADLLGAQFAGSAATKVQTFEGAIAQAKNAFGDLQEEIGYLIIRNPALIGAIQQANELFQQATAYIAANGDAIKALISGGVALLIEGLKQTVEIGSAFIKFLQDNQTALTAVGVGLGVAAAAILAYTAAINASAIAMGIAAAAQGALNIVLSANPIGIVVVALGTFAGALYYLSENFATVQAAVVEFTATMLSAMLPTIENVLAGMAALASVFNEDLANSLIAATETVQASIAALADIQAQGEADADAKRAAELAKRQQMEEAAKAAKLASLRDGQAQALASDRASDAERLVQLQTKLSTEAATQKAAKAAADQADKDAKEAAKAAETKFNQELEAERREARSTVLKAEADWQKQREEQEDKAYRDKIQAETSFTQSLKNAIHDRNSFALASDKERISNFNSTLGQISSLQNSSNKELFAVGKAAAIAQATISTYQAATVALASAPPPFGFALAAAVTAAGLLNVANIANQSPPSAGKFAQGGIVPGASFSGDQMTASVNSREGIFTLNQQKRLFDIANGKAPEASGDSELGNRIDALTNALLSQPVYVAIDGEVVATAVRSQVRGGFDLGVT